MEESDDYKSGQQKTAESVGHLRFGLSLIHIYKRGFLIFGVVSLTMGNSGLPFRYGLPGDLHPLRQLLLSDSMLLPQRSQIRCV